MIKCSSAVSIDKGLIRSNNEDNFYFNGTYLTPEVRDASTKLILNSSEKLQVYGVFDGMGGEELGELASLIAAQSLEECHNAMKHSNFDITKAVVNSAEEANSKICKKIVENGKKRIGATFSALAINDGCATVINVGDSRVYLLRDGNLQQVSIDDTSAQRLVNMGVITPDEAKTHKDKHKLTQHLGIFPDEMIIEPHVSQEIPLKKGDKILLCSDGLTDMVVDEEIQRILLENSSSEELSSKLVDTALKNGGKDNVTAMVVCVLEQNTPKAKTTKSKIIVWQCVTGIVLLCMVVVGAYLFLNNDNKEKDGNVELTAKNISFSNPKHEIPVGAESAFVVTVEPSVLKNKVTFSSSDEEVLDVNKETGDYKTLKKGTVTIKAWVDDKSCEMNVQIYAPAIDIEGVPKELNLKVDETRKLKYEIVPSDADGNIKFVSKDSSIVTVSNDGTIKGIKNGKTQIVVSVKGYQEVIEVSVDEKKQIKDTTTTNNQRAVTTSKEIVENDIEENKETNTIIETPQPEANSNSSMPESSSDDKVGTENDENIQ